MTPVSDGDRGRETLLVFPSEGTLAGLLGARLLLSVVSFGIAIGLDGVGRELTAAAERGLYWTLTLLSITELYLHYATKT